MAMGTRTRTGAVLVLVLAVLALFLALCVDRTEAGFGSNYMAGQSRTTLSGPVLQENLFGAMSRWQEAEGELFVDEPTRRMLATRPYVGYGALNKNGSPCSAGKGSSYYNKNCKANNQNPQPYRRSCTAQGRCMRG